MWSFSVVLLALAEDEPDREAVAFVLVMLLVGIAVVGAILLVMVILWGGRTRRMTRQELPEVREPDPFDAMRAETRRVTNRPIEGGDPESVNDGHDEGRGDDE